MWAKWPQRTCLPGGPQRLARGKIRIGSVTLAISGAHMWAKWLRSSCLLRSPQQGDKIRIGYINLLGGPQMGVMTA